MPVFHHVLLFSVLQRKDGDWDWLKASNGDLGKASSHLPRLGSDIFASRAESDKQTCCEGKLELQVENTNYEPHGLTLP